MDRNERTMDFPPEVMAELRARVTPFALRAYPEPEPLYQKLAEWLGVARDQLLLSSGADGALRSVFETYVEPGEEVVAAAPSYAMYPVYCALTDAKLKEIPFDANLSLPIDRITEAVDDNTKLVVLANPNQPIERVYTDSEITALLETCQQHKTLLVMDEAYFPFGQGSALPWIKRSPYLVVIRSFSKAFGLAGVRLGYMASHSENIKQLHKVRAMYEAHSLGMAFGLYLLEHEEIMTDYVAQVRQALAWLKKALEGMGLEALGQWTNSVLIPLPPELDGHKVAGALKTQGFWVRAEKKPPLDNHLRITVGPPEQAQRLIAAFKNLLAKPQEALS